MQLKGTYSRIGCTRSDDIIGTWEGHCTSEGSAFDDGQEHRWEYKDDGTYVYYVKDEEYREWWEISIDGDTFTATFEMKKVDE